MNSQKSNYSKKQLEIIRELPQLVGLSMSAAAYSGVEGTKQELKSSVKTISQGRILFPDNHLITIALPQIKDQNKLVEQVKKEQEELIAKNYIKELFDIDVFQKRVLKQLEETIYLISNNEKAYIVNEFKKWVLSIAEEVAISAIEDAVFAIETDPYSQKEKDYFRKIEKIIMKL